MALSKVVNVLFLNIFFGHTIFNIQSIYDLIYL
jgi:hypothetical protein